MHEVLKQRLMRKLESLPDDQVYQVLDFIEFLESKYAEAELREEATGLQRFAERIEDGLRRRTVSPGTLREAFQLIAAADRVLSGVASAGKDIIGEINGEERGSGRRDAGGAGRSGEPAPQGRGKQGEGRG